MIFSVIVPIFNVAPYLRQCIESVVNQTFKDWELILVDDGSTDESPRICDEYVGKDSKIRVIHKVNGGLVSARKSGAEVATGDYVLCLDGDDYIDSMCLEKNYQIILESSPEIICFGNNRFSDMRSIPKPLNKYSVGFYNRDQMENILFPTLVSDSKGKRFPANLWGKTFKRGLYLKYQLQVPSEISMGEDVACTYPMIYNSRSLFIIPDCLYNYRQIETSMTKVKKPLSWHNYDLVDEILRKELDVLDFDLHTQLARLRTHNLFNIACSQFRGKGFSFSVISELRRKFNHKSNYHRIIKDSNFDDFICRMARFVLLNQMFFVCYLYSLKR